MTNGKDTPLCGYGRGWDSEGMTTKDDPREVDWAEKKIRPILRHSELLEGRVFKLEVAGTPTRKIEALERRIDHLCKELAEARERVMRLEVQTEFETSEDDARLVDHGRRLGSHDKMIEEMHRNFERRISELEGRSVFMKSHVDLVKRVSALADKIDWIQETEASAQQETDRGVLSLNDRISQLESRLNAYGVPEVRGEYKDQRDPAEMTGGVVSSSSVERHEYERGLRRGAEKALENTEARIRAWAETRMWMDPMALDELLHAVKGERVASEDNDADKPLPRRTPAELGVAPVYTTACPGWQSCYAANQNRAHTHDLLGVVRFDGGRAER